MMATGFAATMAARAPPSLLTMWRSEIPEWTFSLPRSFSTVVTSVSASSPSPTSRKLILYSKPGCCLCDGLKEKLHAAFSLAGPHSLHDVQLEVRDISTNPDWEHSYQYEIPVLARVGPDGIEENLPRLSPRLGVELIQKKIAAALSS